VHLASAVLDDDSTTYWSSRTVPSITAKPHHIDLIFDSRLADVSSITVTPRQDDPTGPGNIGQYAIYLSSDGLVFLNAPVATGTWPFTFDQKTATWPSAYARALRLTVLSSASTLANANIASAAVIVVHGYYIRAPPPCSRLVSW
jgi:F5/8 type C domain